MKDNIPDIFDLIPHKNKYIITDKEFYDYINNLKQEKEYYKLRCEKAIEELFELKDMIYKPETREENFPIQRKISKIIINLGGKDDKL